jgi:hypothetical protein
MGQIFRRSGIYMRRWCWRGGDEWCNDSVVFKAPFLGALCFFWRLGRRRTLPCLKCWHETPEDQKLDYAPCGYMWNGRIRQNAHHHWEMDEPCPEALEWARSRYQPGR